MMRRSQLFTIEITKCAPPSGRKATTLHRPARVHEDVGYPVCDVQIVRASRFIAGVVAKLKKIFESVCKFPVDTARTFRFRPDSRRRQRNQVFSHGTMPFEVRSSQVSEDPATARGGMRTDAARKLREHGDIGRLAVNAFEAVLRGIEQKAR